MKNIIAVIWDFDKTLVDGYMQDPIFKEYHVDASAFWREVNSLPEKYMREQHVRVNPDTIYLNQFLRYVKDGRFRGLNNEKLEKYGNLIPEISRIWKRQENFQIWRNLLWSLNCAS